MSTRREFITLLGGAAAAWPLAGRAQEGERVRRIGLLTNLSQSDPEGHARDEAFVRGLRQLGWAVDGNLQIERRFTGGDPELGRRYARELVALAPDVLLTTGSAGLIPMLQATRTVPIVFAGLPRTVSHRGMADHQALVAGSSEIAPARKRATARLLASGIAAARGGSLAASETKCLQPSSYFNGDFLEIPCSCRCHRCRRSAIRADVPAMRA